MADQLYGFFCGIRPRSGDHKGPPGGGFHTEFHHPAMLYVAERGRFARGAAGDKPMRSRGDLPLNQCYKRLFIHYSVTKGCDEGGQ